tara:strand:+ start:34530 stop:34640 length:111 start_codon:yes stop_codon:yes gene_type:complete
MAKYRIILCKGGTLPIELIALELVGDTGLEPVTSTL